MITSAQLRAARALLGIDQRALAALAGVSLPTIQRMEVSEGQVRGVIDTLVKVMEALENAGVELIGDHSPSTGAGRGVRLKAVAARTAPQKQIATASWMAGETDDGAADLDGQA